jgi:hypothetical protein
MKLLTVLERRVGGELGAGAHCIILDGNLIKRLFSGIGYLQSSVQPILRVYSYRYNISWRRFA